MFIKFPYRTNFAQHSFLFVLTYHDPHSQKVQVPVVRRLPDNAFWINSCYWRCQTVGCIGVRVCHLLLLLLNPICNISITQQPPSGLMQILHFDWLLLVINE